MLVDRTTHTNTFLKGVRNSDINFKKATGGEDDGGLKGLPRGIPEGSPKGPTRKRIPHKIPHPKDPLWGTPIRGPPVDSFRGWRD